MIKPVSILTGFLGAGKTTYLNHILQQNKDTRYAIIENEFGEQGVDNELIIQPDSTIVEMNNGCLCCTLNDNLYDILNELHERRDEFDEIIIEATGVADPSGLAQPFLTHPVIKKHFPLVATICLIDAEIVEDQLRDTVEAINQITYSDILLINKIDLVSEDYVDILKRKLQAINPLARILQGHQNKFPNFSYNKAVEASEDILIQNKTPTTSCTHKHEHHHEHTKDINSQCFVIDEAFNYDFLYQQLFVYLTFQSKDLCRMKGIFYIENQANQFVLQSVGKRLSVDEKRPWKSDEEKKSVIVFIGKQLERAGLEKLLHRCLAKSTKTQSAEIPIYRSHPKIL